MRDDKPSAQTTERSCTCHPSEAPVPCQHKYAFSECVKAAAQTTEPCPHGESCPDARKYGSVHPLPTETTDRAITLRRGEWELNMWIVPFAAGALAALLVCEALGLNRIMQ